MIQNPNEIAAKEQHDKVMTLIAKNARTVFTINRRQFLCGSAAALTFAVLGLAGCMPKQTSSHEEQSYQVGTYEASEEGRNGAVKVKVAFSNKALTNIETEHEESRNIGNTVINLLKERYLKSQSLNFDVVTDASLSPMAFSTAIASCIDQAGGSVAVLKKPIPA